MNNRWLEERHASSRLLRRRYLLRGLLAGRRRGGERREGRRQARRYCRRARRRERRRQRIGGGQHHSRGRRRRAERRFDHRGPGGRLARPRGELGGPRRRTRRPRRQLLADRRKIPRRGETKKVSILKERRGTAGLWIRGGCGFEMGGGWVIKRTDAANAFSLSSGEADMGELATGARQVVLLLDSNAPLAARRTLRSILAAQEDGARAKRASRQPRSSPTCLIRRKANTATCHGYSRLVQPVPSVSDTSRLARAPSALAPLAPQPWHRPKRCP